MVIVLDQKEKLSGKPIDQYKGKCMEGKSLSSNDR